MFYHFIVFLTTLFLVSANTNDTQCPYISAAPNTNNNVTRTRIMQYNVEWLFLKTYNNCPGSGCSWATLADATTHLTYLADVIADYSPDIITLCEVEGCYELGQLNAHLGNVYQPYLLFGTDSATGQNVGVLTKLTPAADLKRSAETKTYPIAGSHCGGSSGSTGVSKHYYTEYNINGKTVFLLSNNPNAELILLGDFNDYDAEVADSNGDKPITAVLDILKGVSGEHAGEYTLVSAASLVQQSQRYTSWWDPNDDCVATPNEMSMIDHVLMTPGLVDKVAQVVFAHPYTEYCGTYNSDHYPVMVDFLW